MTLRSWLPFARGDPSLVDTYYDPSLVDTVLRSTLVDTVTLRGHRDTVTLVIARFVA